MAASTRPPSWVRLRCRAHGTQDAFQGCCVHTQVCRAQAGVHGDVLRRGRGAGHGRGWLPQDGSRGPTPDRRCSLGHLCTAQAVGTAHVVQPAHGNGGPDLEEVPEEADASLWGMDAACMGYRIRPGPPAVTPDSTKAPHASSDSQAPGPHLCARGLSASAMRRRQAATMSCTLTGQRHSSVKNVVGFCGQCKRGCERPRRVCL